MKKELKPARHRQTRLRKEARRRHRLARGIRNEVPKKANPPLSKETISKFLVLVALKRGDLTVRQPQRRNVM